MFKFNLHFEMYRIRVVLGDDEMKVRYYCGMPQIVVSQWGYCHWFYTKHKADKTAKMLTDLHKNNVGATWHFYVERAIRSDKVRERISQKVRG